MNLFYLHLFLTTTSVWQRETVSIRLLDRSYLVLDEQRALWWMREVGCGPLHHQFEDGVCWDVV